VLDETIAPQLGSMSKHLKSAKSAKTAEDLDGDDDPDDDMNGGDGQRQGRMSLRIPQWTVEDAWVAWVVGNRMPWCRRRKTDLPQNQRSRFRKLSALMGRLVRHARQQQIDLENLSVRTARSLYRTHLKHCVRVPGRQHARRHDQLAFTTVLKNLEAAERAARLREVEQE
jgi:hypothetical protein